MKKYSPFLRRGFSGQGFFNSHSSSRGLSNILGKRFFLTEVKPELLVPTRILQKPDNTGFELQTYEPHLLYKELIENEQIFDATALSVNKESSRLNASKRTFLRDLASTPWRKFFNNLTLNILPNTWETKLSISSEGLITGNKFSPLSSNFIKKLKERNESRERGSKLDQYEIQILDNIHDLVYTIPQSNWNEFLILLEDQKVVQLLDLKKHRHIWQAYNHAIQAPQNSQIRDNRAKAMGQFHFLMDIFRMPNNNRCLYPTNLTAEQIRSRIDNGVSPIEIFSGSKPYLTPRFMNALAYCPSWYDLNHIGENLIQPKVTGFNRKINKEKLNEFIAALPAARKHPELFIAMLRDVDNLRLTFNLDKNIKARLFYQSRNNFGQLNITHLNSVLLTDYFAAIARDLIFPEFIRQLWINAEAAQRFDVADDDEISDLCKSMAKLCGILLTENIKPEKLLRLHQNWHRNMEVIDAKKPKSHFVKEWHPLFNEQVIDNVTFTCLTSDYQLKLEGKEMNHCVGGYTSDCMLGNSHIIMVKSHSGERSTLQLILENDIVSIRQNFSQGNKTPDVEIQRACTKLIEMINEKKIALNPLRGRTTMTALNVSAANVIYPYRFDDENIQELVYQAYRDTGVLGTNMKANTYKEMLEKSGIVEAIKEVVIKRTPLQTPHCS